MNPKNIINDEPVAFADAVKVTAVAVLYFIPIDEVAKGLILVAIIAWTMFFARARSTTVVSADKRVDDVTKTHQDAQQGRDELVRESEQARVAKWISSCVPDDDPTPAPRTRKPPPRKR